MLNKPNKGSEPEEVKAVGAASSKMGEDKELPAEAVEMKESVLTGATTTHQTQSPASGTIPSNTSKEKAGLEELEGIIRLIRTKGEDMDTIRKNVHKKLELHDPELHAVFKEMSR